MTQAKVKVVKKNKKKPTSAGEQKSAKCRRARERNQNKIKNKQQKIYSEILSRGPELLLGWSAPRCARVR